MHLLILATLTATNLPTPSAQAATPIPDAPYYYVLDDARIFNTQQTYALQTLLIKHDHASSEQFMVAIFDSLDGEPLADFTSRLFQAWKIGQRGKNNGILLVISLKELKAQVEVGYGLENILTAELAEEIVSSHLLPPLRDGKPAQAIAQTAFEILRILESPLIPSGDAEEILESGDFDHGMTSFGEKAALGLILGGIGLAVCALLFVGYRMNTREIHYSSEGKHVSSIWPGLPSWALHKRHREQQKFSGGGTYGSW